MYGIGLFLVINHTASATVIINPEAGWSGSFAWIDAPGQIDFINYDPFNPSTDNDWSITAAVDSQMSFATAYDYYLPAGDEFEFVLDGTAVAWDSAYIDSGGLFHGELYDLFLSAGTHLLTINVTTFNNPGLAFAEFSGLAEVIRPGEILSVPEPAILSLFSMGLLLVFGFRQNANGKCYCYKSSCYKSLV
jgi:hypothetical protein